MPESVARRADATPLASPRVLIAEPDPEMRGVVAFLLRHQGYAVLEAADAESSLQLWRRHAPSVVVMSERLAGAADPQLCAQIRTRGATAVLLLSMANGESEPTRAQDVDDVVSLPFCTTELLARVRAMLATPDFEGNGPTA